jgi:HEAT repeat protein
LLALEQTGGAMTTSIGDDGLEPGSPGNKTNLAVRPHSRVRLAIMLAVCGGAIYWAGSAVWEHAHPSVAMARALRSTDPDQRLTAIREMSALGPDESGAALKSLLPALADPVGAVRSTAAEALGRVATIAVTAGKDPEAARAAVTGLFAALKDPDASVRLEAAGAVATLAEIASGTSGRAPGRGKAKTAQSTTRLPSVIDLRAVVAALLELLGDPDIEVRRIALLGLGKVAPKVSDNPPQAVFAAIEDESPMIREAALTASAGFPRDLDALIPALLRHAEHDDPMVQAACIRALGRIKPSAISPAVSPALIAGLKSRGRDVRLHLVSLIGRISPDPRLTVPALIAVLREADESDQQRMAGQMMMIAYAGPAQEAAQVLGRIAPGTPAAGQAISALTEVVQSGPQKRRAAAAKALVQFGRSASGAVAGLVALLQEAATGKQLSEDGPSAARALGQIAPGTAEADKAVAALAAVLQSDWAPIREAAVKAIASFKQDQAGLPGVLPKLRELHEKDKVPAIRAAAEAALEKLTVGPSAATQFESSDSKPEN